MIWGRAVILHVVYKLFSCISLDLTLHIYCTEIKPNLSGSSVPETVVAIVGQHGFKSAQKSIIIQEN